MNYEAINYVKTDDGFTVELKRDDVKFFVNVWITNGEVDSDWDHYISAASNEEEEFRQKIQADDDEFIDASGIAICFLESENVIAKDKDDKWTVTEDDTFLEDIEPEDNKITYYVNLLGYDKDDNITDFDKEVESYNNKEAAVDCADFLAGHLLDLIEENKVDIKIPEEVKYLHIVVDSTVENDIVFEEVVDVETGEGDGKDAEK